MVIKDLDSLKVLKIHGKGRHASVYKTLDTVSQKIVALKKHPKHIACHTMYDYYEREKNAFEVLPSHDNIVKFYFYEESEDDAFFCMEFIDGYTLQRIIYESKSDKIEKNINRRQIKSYLLQVLDVIKHCHDNFIYHGDIKPENIIVSNDDKVTVVDFSSSIISNVDTINVKDVIFLGTPGFMPPEVADHEYRGEFFLPFLDIWAFGCTMYFAYTRVVPFVEKINAESNNNVKRLNVDMSTLPDDVKYVLEHIFTKDVQKRYTDIDKIRDLVKTLREE